MDYTFNLAYYTCFYGSDNNPCFHVPELPSLKNNCFFFTNNKSIFNLLSQTNWITIYQDIKTSDDLIQSCFTGKHIKCLPELYTPLQQYNYLIFFDNKLPKINDITIQDAIVENFIQQNYAMILRVHCFLPHGSVYDEFNESMKQLRYQAQKKMYEFYIESQLKFGLQSSTPSHYMCGFIIRNMTHPKIRDINLTWYDHILQCGIQDQISFYFVKQLFEDCITHFNQDPFH